MAFGKNPGDLKQVSDFRQASRVSNRKFPARKGGGGFRWQDRFQPSTVEPDMIRFVPGSYVYTAVKDNGETEDFSLPYARFAEHFDGRTNTSCICSAGPFVMYKDKRDPCLGCDLFWENPKKGGRMSRREMYSFSILNYGTFHEVDQVDQNTGKVRINEKTNKPYTQWARCTGRRCDACAAQKPTKKGHMQHWEMGHGHFTALKDYARLIGRSCKTCRGKNTVTALAYLCSNCQDSVIDMTTTQMTDEEILKVVENEATCPHCRFTGYLNEFIECSGTMQDAHGNIVPCPEPIRAGIFDVDIGVKRVQGDGNQTTLTFTEYGPVSEIDPAYNAKPIDLTKMYEPDSLQTQSDKFKEPIPNAKPAAPQPTSSVTRPYGGQPAQQPAPPQEASPPRTPVTRSGGMFNRG